MAQTFLEKVLAVLSYNGEINELNPLNSSTGARTVQKLSLEKFLAMLSHITE